jgi:hypothetical protein
VRVFEESGKGKGPFVNRERRSISSAGEKDGKDGEKGANGDSGDDGKDGKAGDKHIDESELQNV